MGAAFPTGRSRKLNSTDDRLAEVSVTRIRQVQSEAEVTSDAQARAAGCGGYKNMIAVEAEQPSMPAVAGPVFPVRPQQLHVCIYRQAPGDPTSSEFLRGRQLDQAETARLVDELGQATTTTADTAGPDPLRQP